MGNTDLDWQLRRATQVGNRAFIDNVSDLRWRLNRAAQSRDWREYNEAARKLNALGADITPITIPVEESVQMGMFDKPMYLTGENGFVSAGDIFWLHNAKVEPGTGKFGDQAKLLVSHEKDSEKMIVYTSGKGVVNQIKRMDNSDRAAMPLEVRLDQVPSREGSPTNVITPANQEPPVGAAASNGSGEADF